MLKVLIVDDEFIVRTGLINCINWKGLHLTLIGEAANGREALEIIQQKAPDIVLLDMIMPEMSGMELIQKLEELNIRTNIIILSCHEDYNYVRDAFKKECVIISSSFPPLLMKFQKLFGMYLRKSYRNRIPLLSILYQTYRITERYVPI